MLIICAPPVERCCLCRCCLASRRNLAGENKAQASSVRVVEYTPGALAQLPYLRIHQFLYRFSHGLVGRHVGGHPALLLTTRGRRSNRERVVALIYARRGKALIVVASNGGSAHEPGWYRNLMAEPQVLVLIGRKHFAARARVAEGAERDELWNLVNRKNRGFAPLIHPGAKGRYDVYQRHAQRQIPIVVLTPSS